MKKFLLILSIFLFSFTIVWAKSNYYNEYEHFEKSIRINTYANKLSYYEFSKKIWEFEISSWDAENYTPQWRFRITNKNERMLSKWTNKWMPYWMEFWEWIYWIHALPEDYNWNLDTTSRIWEVAAWWCVRLTKENAEKLYSWVENWTVVLIKNDKTEYADDENDLQTIKTYFDLINQEKFEEAYNMKLNLWYSLEKFISLNKWYRFEITEIKQINWWDFTAKITIYKWDNITNRVTSKFFISNNKIIRSYVLK